MAAAIRQPDSLAPEELLPEPERKRPRSPAGVSRRLHVSSGNDSKRTMCSRS